VDGQRPYITVVSAFEAVVAVSAAKMSREDFEGIERHMTADDNEKLDSLLSPRER
jgi:hypothetical protein